MAELLEADMNIKGVASIKLVYDDGREESFGPPVFNDICWLSFRRFFGNNTSMSLPTKRDAISEVAGGNARWRLYYGSVPIKQTPLNSWYPEDGIVNVDTNTPVYTPGVLPTDPDVMRFTATIQAPIGSPRTIAAIGLDATNNTIYSAFTDLHASRVTILNLTTPCIQNTNVTVAITYDLYLYPLQDTLDDRVNHYVYEHMKTLLKRASDAVASTSISYSGILRAIGFGSYDLNQIPSHGLPGTNTAQTSDLEYTSDGLSVVTPTMVITPNAITINRSYGTTYANGNGCFIKSQFIGGGGYNVSDNNKIQHAMIYNNGGIEGDLNPVQNVYPQRNNPPGPSQDLTFGNTATMTGNMVFNTSAWSDPLYQKLVRVKIGTSGDVGTATYKISIMNFIGGFVGNKWNSRCALLPHSLSGHTFKKSTNYEHYEDVYTSGINYPTISQGAITYRSPDNDRFVIAANCTRTKNGVNIYDVLNGNRYSMNALNGLGVTAVSDAECTPNYFFVTCANTGLWRVSLDRNTVEQLPSPTGNNSAYQICKKNDASNSLWILFDGGLCKLSNPEDPIGVLSWVTHNASSGAPTFTFTGITDNNWSNVTGMIVDPDNLAVDRFLFVIGNLPSGDTSGAFRKGFVWWDTSSGAATNPGTNGVSYNTGTYTWSHSNTLLLSDSIRCVAGYWLMPRTWLYIAHAMITKTSYGATNLESVYFNTKGGDRAIPSRVNGIEGFFICNGITNNTQPSMFIRGSVLSTIPTNTTLNPSSSYVEFAVRNGTSSTSTDLSITTAIRSGHMAIPVAYLSDSNTLMMFEDYSECYSTGNVMLDPSHSKYATYAGAFWKDYGWDGATWVLGHAGFKTTNAVNETIPILDNLGIAFTNGSTGTSFVANEWFSFVVGLGVFKDNGVTYNSSFSFSFDPTKTIAFNAAIPQTSLGVLTDEPVTFSLFDTSVTGSSMTDQVSHYITQQKGLVVSKSGIGSSPALLIADQLIPANTVFDLRFKWLCLKTYSGAGSYQYYGVATGTTTYTMGVHFRYDRTTGVMTVYNNTTLLATVVNPSYLDEFRIARDGSNNVIAYQNGTPLHTPVVVTSTFVIAAHARDGSQGQGWWDMKLSYTENRRVYRVGNPVGNQGSYSPKFSALTYVPSVGDTNVNIGTVSPLPAILDYTSAGNALTGTGRVKVCPGAGWLIFHDSEPANTFTGSTVAHFVLNHQ